MPLRSLRHRSTRPGVAALALASAVACSKDAIVTTRTVTAYVPSACAVDGGGYATYSSLGDYPSTPPQTGHFLRDETPTLTEIDTRARELVVTASEGGRAWEGRTSVAGSGDVDVMVLPAFQSCRLTAGVGARAGSTLAPIGSGRALLVGGDDPSVLPASFVVRLDTAGVTRASPELQVPRKAASVTAFADGGLVAGGLSLSTGQPTGDAQVFDPSVDGFATRIALSEPRARQGAVVLRDGRTLLVGGVGGADGKTALSSMEIVDPASREAHEEGVARLRVPLASPAAVVLASGEVLVAGEASLQGVAQTVLEWFTSGAQPSGVAMQSIPAGSALALVALEAGGALAVVAPPAGATGSFQNTWLIGARHTVDAASPVQGTLTQPALLGGAGGAPLLWTGDRWLQWSPWSGAFVASSILDRAPAPLAAASCSPDPGLALWFDPASTHLFALRFDTRNAFSALTAALLVDDTSDVAPDSLPGPGAVSFDSATGLTLAGGASAFVTDRTFADFSLRATAPAEQPPDVVMRDESGAEHVVASSCCPGLAQAGSTSVVLDVERRGDTVTCALAGGASGACSTGLAASSRVQLGFRSSPSRPATIVRDVVVSRVAPP